MAKLLQQSALGAPGWRVRLSPTVHSGRSPPPNTYSYTFRRAFRFVSFPPVPTVHASRQIARMAHIPSAPGHQGSHFPLTLTSATRTAPRGPTPAVTS